MGATVAINRRTLILSTIGVLVVAALLAVALDATATSGVDSALRERGHASTTVIFLVILSVFAIVAGVLAAIVALAWIATGIHELAHFIAARRHGWTVTSIYVRPLVVEFDQGQKKFRLSANAYPLGGYVSTSSVTPTATAIRSIYTAGPVASAIGALVFGLVGAAAYFSAHGWIAGALFLESIACLMGVLSLYPQMHARQYPSDGLVLLQLRQDADATVQWIRSVAIVDRARDQRPRDWNMEEIDEALKAPNSLVYARHMRFCAEWDRGAYRDCYSTALDLWRLIEAGLLETPGIGDVIWDLAGFFVRFGGEPDLAERIRAIAIERWPNARGRSHAEARFAWAQGDVAQAETLVAEELKTFLDKNPSPAVEQYTREFFAKVLDPTIPLDFAKNANPKP